MSSRDDQDTWPPVDAHDDPDDEMFSRRESRGRSRGVPDFVRRAIENTMGSVQSTGAVSKEAIHFFLSTTDKRRREIVRMFATEVGDFLKHADISSEIVKVLTSVEADVEFKVRFRRTDDGKVVPEAAAKEPAESPDEEKS